MINLRRKKHCFVILACFVIYAFILSTYVPTLLRHLPFPWLCYQKMIDPELEIILESAEKRGLEWESSPEDFHPVYAKMPFQSSTFKRGKCSQPPCYFFLHCLANSTEIYVFHLYFAEALPERCILLQQTEWQAS